MSVRERRDHICFQELMEADFVTRCWDPRHASVFNMILNCGLLLGSIEG